LRFYARALLANKEKFSQRSEDGIGNESVVVIFLKYFLFEKILK
jgi:hypothetical protein